MFNKISFEEKQIKRTQKKINKLMAQEVKLCKKEITRAAKCGERATYYKIKHLPHYCKEDFISALLAMGFRVEHHDIIYNVIQIFWNYKTSTELKEEEINRE